MDIKFQWVTTHQRYAFILTILDCFTRKALYWHTAYAIKKDQVISAWENVIVNYLQPHGMLQKQVTIEIRNDNDSRFAARAVQQYLSNNGLMQVFRHSYTPQENGHIESFHSILGRSLERKGSFDSLMHLEKHLQHFHKTYNEVRLHGNLDHLSPAMFWHLWSEGFIKRVETNKGVRYKLNRPHYLLLGNGFPGGSIRQNKIF